MNALLEAGPDVAEHVVRAAQELLLAAQTVVDAAQRAVEEQQALRQPARPDAEPGVAGTGRGRRVRDGRLRACGHERGTGAGRDRAPSRRRRVSPAPAAPTLGVDLGGTNLRMGAVDADGRLLGEERVPCPTTGWRGVVTAIGELGGQMAAAFGASSLGVGVAALVDRDGNTRFAPNIPGMVDAPLRAALADTLSMPVVVDNDANAAAWGEACHGAARGVDDALVVTLGTGIGGGIIAGGRVYRGAHGFAAEIGHWQFERGGARVRVRGAGPLGGVRVRTGPRPARARGRGGGTSARPPRPRGR